MNRRRGVALVSVLWVLAILSVMGLGFAMTVRVHGELVDNRVLKAQAQGLARTGMEMAFELYYAGQAEGRTYNASNDEWMAFSSEDIDHELADGTYSIRVVDEAGKLNVNLAEQEHLYALIGDEDVAAAIMDWRDGDDDSSLGGAESFYYEESDPPYRARNGRFRSIGELALVQGITSEMLWGPDEDQYRERRPEEIRGLADLLTVIAIDSNHSSSTGNPRINLNTASEQEIEEALSGVIAEGSIQSIIDYRRQRTTRAQPQDGQTGAPPLQVPGELQPPTGGGGFGGGGPVGIRQFDPTQGGFDPTQGMEGPQQPGQAGEEEEAQQAFASTGELINVPSLSDEDIQAIWDLVTAESAGVIEGRININTAPQEVLASVIDADLAQEIIEYRTSRGPLPTVAHLLSVDPSVRANFVELANLLTTRSYVFTIEATGRAGRDEITHRIRAVVDLSGDEPNYLMICHY